MNEILNILKENQVQYFATVGRDGKAKVRPFSFCFEMEGKLWFGTNNTKEVYKDLEQNPFVELAVVTSDMITLRLSGKVIFEDNRKVKEEMMNIENLKTKAEADISEYITKKIIELKKKTGKEVTSIQFTAREKMTGLESYDVKINLI